MPVIGSCQVVGLKASRVAWSACCFDGLSSVQKPWFQKRDRGGVPNEKARMLNSTPREIGMKGNDAVRAELVNLTKALAVPTRHNITLFQKNSDTGNRTPGYRVRGDNVSHYTISDVFIRI